MPRSVLRPSLLLAALLALGLVPGRDVAGQALGRRVAGPVIQSAGAVYAVEDADFPTETGPRKVLFDVAVGATDPADVNARLETLARYLNMHAQAGVDPGDMQLAVVVHGSAGRDLLNHEAFQARYGVDNPNHALVQELIGVGVDVILCGQTAMHRGLPRRELASGVQVALSAMTALVSLQEAGYRLIPF
jgi:intracellular sulfur oxidation DsrE/DsrF family protein